MTENLNLIVTQERLQDTPLEVFYYLDTNASPRILIDYIARFVADENGQFLPPEEAVKRVLEGRTLSDLEEIAQELMQATEMAVVPKT